MCPRCPFSRAQPLELLDHVQRVHLHQVKQLGATVLARESANLIKPGPRNFSQKRLDGLTNIALKEVQNVFTSFQDEDEELTDDIMEDMNLKLKECLKWFGEAVLSCSGTIVGGERGRPGDNNYLQLKSNLANLS